MFQEYTFFGKTFFVTVFISFFCFFTIWPFVAIRFLRLGTATEKLIKEIKKASPEIYNCLHPNMRVFFTQQKFMSYRKLLQFARSEQLDEISTIKDQKKVLLRLHDEYRAFNKPFLISITFCFLIVSIQIICMIAGAIKFMK